MTSVVHDPRYFADLGEHIMPIRKFQLVREAIVATGGARWHTPSPVSDADLLRVHTAAYIDAIRTGEPLALAQSQKFPWSPALAEAVRWTNGGCVLAASLALDEGVCANLASGFHHSHAAFGEGFCTFNGLVVALERLRAEGRLRRALVLDMDLHYGNGTASLLAERPWAFQLSIYGNYYKKNLAIRDVTLERTEDTANCRSIAVPAGANGDQYLDLLAQSLDAMIDHARPELLLYQAGADPYKEDPYSPLDLDHDALAARDRFVFACAKRRGLPVMWVLAGGYTKDVTKVVTVHHNTFLEAERVFGG